MLYQKDKILQKHQILGTVDDAHEKKYHILGTVEDALIKKKR